MINIGSSGTLFTDRFTMDCHVVETRLYPNRPSDCWGVARQAIDNGIYVIFNVCISDHDVVKDYTDSEWKQLINHVVIQLQAMGGNKQNCRLTVINEPMKYITKERYAHLINLAHEAVRDRLLVGAGNEEFLLAQAKGDMYSYILNYADFDILDIHIQGACLKESECVKWTNWVHNLAVSHTIPLDCTEANMSDVSKASGYSTLLMQLRYAEKIFCKHFPIVFIGLSNEDKYMWLSFIYNGVVRNEEHWADLQRIMKEKAYPKEVFNMYGIEINYVKPGCHNEECRAVQQLMLDEGYDLSPYGADSWYGDVTEEAIRKWQSDNDLKIDGIVGKETWEWIMDNIDTGIKRFIQMLVRTGRYK